MCIEDKMSHLLSSCVYAWLEKPANVFLFLLGLGVCPLNCIPCFVHILFHISVLGGKITTDRNTQFGAISIDGGTAKGCS